MIDWEGFRQSRFAADARGHSARMSFRIQPQIVRVMAELVKEFDDEYQEPADLIRHSIREHIRRLQDYRDFVEDDRIRSTMAQVNSMLQVLEMEEQQADFELVITKAHEVVTKMYAAGAHGEVVRLLRDLRTKVGTMASDFWKEKYLNELKVRFGHLEKQAAGMSLDPGKDD
jgi:Arc/MetJ-type ribon-helix-helix transcriptional regulator